MIAMTNSIRLASLCAPATRRRVIGIGAGLAAGMMLAPRMASAQQPQLVLPVDMATRLIPHSGERIPVIGLGTAGGYDVGENSAKKEALAEVIGRLIAGGGKLIDTASTYTGAEATLGAVIPLDGRSKLFLATKVENGDLKQGSPELRRSLERLRTTQVDLLQLHNVHRSGQSLAAFRDWKTAGLCRYIGITTTFDGDYPAAEAVLRREKPDFLQIDYSLDNRAVEKRILPLAAEVGAAVLTALPFGRTSVFRAVQGRPVPEWAKEFDTTTWPQFFLKYLLGNAAVTAVIPGTANPEHMADNLAAGQGRFPDAAQRKRMVAFFESL